MISPQRRADQTDTLVAAACNPPVDIDDRFAEYDRSGPLYIPIKQVCAENPAEWVRMTQGHLPGVVARMFFLHAAAQRSITWLSPPIPKTLLRCSAMTR
nr:histidine phosphatase family protein [Mycobacterium leprae]